MRYLVDSDWVADFLKGRRQAYEFLSPLRRDGLAISLITFGEIYEGIYYSWDPAKDAEAFRLFLEEVPALPLTEEIMQRYALLRGELRRRGQPVGVPDLLIAATALHLDLTLLTRNVRDFARVPGLRLTPPG